MNPEPLNGYYWRYVEDSETESAAELLKLKPDFPARGGILIRHYIKFEDIVERVIEGLEAADIAVSKTEA